MNFQPNKKQFIAAGQIRALKTAAFVVMPVPYERTTSYGKGTQKGPDAIIEASHQLELWDEELKKETWEKGILTLKPYNCAQSEKKFFGGLETAVEGLLEATKAFPFFLGGEHSISQGLIPPFQRRHKDLSVLHFDAHADLRSEYEGSPHSHASALYPASRTSRVVQIGIRSVSSDERCRTGSGNVKTYLMHENLDLQALEKNVLRDLTGTVYLTLDVDGFDPSVMPGTGTPQPGGFFWHDALRILRSVCLKKKVVGADIVEVCPVKGSHITEFNAAKLIYRLMGYLS